MSNVMELEARNFLANRLPYLRRSIMALGKFGMGKDYYRDHLDEIVKEARYVSQKLEWGFEQMRVGDDG